ncbi:MAG: hypothetical protein NXI19_15635 [Alphaproteobacteria bacterium]|nr:hypothetical protein [Alphaproteobacteria bacterium]
MTDQRDFLKKLNEQLAGASPEVPKLAAEVLWFLNLFPSRSAMKPGTKREQIEHVWGWSGDPAPDSIYLDEAHMHGVGNPGTAYATHRPMEFEYLLRTVIAYKKLPQPEQSRLMGDDPPWIFMRWLDEQEGSDRRLVRNTLLYFLFPDYIERNTSRNHKRQIYQALKGKLPPEKRIPSKNGSMLDLDRAIFEIREVLEEERGTTEIDFYDDEIKPQWFSRYREASTKDFSSWLNSFLSDRGLQLNQSGRDIRTLDEKRAVNPETGFWEKASYVTSKPPRWLLHFEATGSELVASVPDHNRSGVIGYANTKGGNSGALAVRILPVMKVAEKDFRLVENWEWFLLFCFPGGLPPGSSGEAFENFDVKSGTLTYMGQNQPYIFAGLLGLNSPEETFSASVDGALKTITYQEATEALAKLINVTEVRAADA